MNTRLRLDSGEKQLPNHMLSTEENYVTKQLSANIHIWEERIGLDRIGHDRTRQDNTTKRMNENESIHKKFRYFNKVWLKTRTKTIQEDIRRLQTDVHRMESCSVSGNEKRTNRQSHSWVPPTLCWPGRWLAVVVQNQEIWKHSHVNMVNGIWDYSQCHAGEYNFKDFSGNIVGILGKSRTLGRL